MMAQVFNRPLKQLLTHLPMVGWNISLSSCGLYIWRTIHLISFALVMFIVKCPEKCSVEFVAICTQVNINNLWKAASPGSPERKGYCWSQQQYVHDIIAFMARQWKLIPQVWVLCSESSFAELWISRSAAEQLEKKICNQRYHKPNKQTIPNRQVYHWRCTSSNNYISTSSQTFSTLMLPCE